MLLFDLTHCDCGLANSQFASLKKEVCDSKCRVLMRYRLEWVQLLMIPNSKPSIEDLEDLYPIEFVYDLRYTKCTYVDVMVSSHANYEELRFGSIEFVLTSLYLKPILSAVSSTYLNSYYPLLTFLM